MSPKKPIREIDSVLPNRYRRFPEHRVGHDEPTGAKLFLWGVLTGIVLERLLTAILFTGWSGR